METPIKMDDLGVPLFLETPKWWPLMIFRPLKLLEMMFVKIPGFFGGDAGTSHRLRWLLIGALQPHHQPIHSPCSFPTVDGRNPTGMVLKHGK